MGGLTGDNLFNGCGWDACEFFVLLRTWDKQVDGGAFLLLQERSVGGYMEESFAKPGALCLLPLVPPS